MRTVILFSIVAVPDEASQRESVTLRLEAPMAQGTLDNILSQIETLSSEERAALLAALSGPASNKPASRQSAYGKYAGRLSPVEEFLREKHLGQGQVPTHRSCPELSKARGKCLTTAKLSR
jgi:hypothetical protein